MRITLKLQNLPLFLFFILVSGCGGGTTGTGGTGNSEFSGKILDISGSPVAQALITLEETGDSAVSDDRGSFLLESKIETDMVTLLVDSKETEAQTVIDEIPAGAQEIDLSLELDRKEKTVKVTKKTIAPRPKPTRTPRPVVTSGTDGAEPTLAPEPTISITEVPALPEGTPTPLSTGTVEPEATPSAEATPPALFLKTLFLGSVSSSNPVLLANARIGIVGKGKIQIAADGTFKFRVPADQSNGTIAIAANGKFSRLKIDGISDKTKRVRLQLQLEQRTDLSIKLTLKFAEIVDL
jgi:hypothetical protein